MRKSICIATLMATGLLGASGCGGAPSTTITDVTDARAEDAQKPPAMTPAQRLRVNTNFTAPATAAAPGTDSVPPAATAPMHYTVPEGWETLPETPMRTVNLMAAPNTECYVTVLAGTGGGLESNLNRWRGQMGLPELSGPEIAALAKRPLLDGEASYIDITGTFTGMGGIGEKPDYRMLGLALVSGNRAVFIKMTGPATEVEAQIANFNAFCDSLHDNTDGHTHDEAPAAPAEATSSNLPAGHPPIPPTTTATPSGLPEGHPPVSAASTQLPANHPPMPASQPGMSSSANYAWTAPPSWEQAPDRMMRVVTYKVGESECYITQLDGPAGGVEANLNRWRGQVGQPPLTADEIAALPTINVLGVDATLIQATGPYTDMSGATVQGYALLGVIVQLENRLVTIKMTGPEAELSAELENFKSFCTSISPQ